MSIPLGVDLGNDNTVIACARNRGIDIIVNEVSNRSTPSLVGFGIKNRFIGESAKNQQISNIKNTVANFKRTLGLNSADPDLAVDQKFSSAPLVDNSAGQVSAKVRFLGEQQVFTVTQLTAMFLSKIKDITAKETKANVTDICLSVPVWYTEKQRRAAADACKIAGLNPVRIVNEVTAAAVGYGVFKQNDLPEDEPKKVAFIDIGHSSYQVSIAAVKRGELKILGSAYDKHFGGRDFDYAIANHFAEEFKTKYKFDVRENAKAFARVVTASERVKKVLSANTQAPINIESLMNDIDVSSSITREELQGYIQPLLNRIHVPIEVALKDAGLSPADLDSIEVIGGCTRVPSLKAKLSEIFGKPLSFTLNQDEAIVRGNAFICAMHSPTLRVRPFKFEDFNPYSVSYFWDKQEEDDDHMEVFPRGGLFPSTKIITLFRKGDFEVEARYTNKEQCPPGVEPLIAKWLVKGVVPNEGEQYIATKLKLRNDPSGFYTIESAHTVQEVIVKELVEKEESSEDAEGEGEDEEPEYREIKKVVKKNDLTLEMTSAALSKSVRNELFEKENAMFVADKLVADTEDRKNALEEYIYELRGKLEDQYAKFASDAEKEKLTGLLAKTEEWLYDDGYDSTKAKYIAKYEELASIGNLIKGRYLADHEEKKQAMRQKQEASQMAAMAEKMAAAREPSKGEKAAEEQPKNAEEMDFD
ncbi:heat shock protein 70 [Metschnikowia bicuspidata]|uniref:Heat shock protein 70 n=1 Tax=Metschnikowia bicuspidata TaxID=27322 RepID=A0A4P9ZE16_9ASCO|nr:heat shock protein 70 [Metschnikowia bicuspidata]